MRGFWIALFSFALATSAALFSGGSAVADDCGCGPRGYGGGYGHCRPSNRVVVPRHGCGGGVYLRGGSWYELRRGLGQGSFYDPTRRWVRDHYLRRFPFSYVVGQESVRMQTLLSEDLLAVLSEEQGKEVKLDTATQLDRAAARFFVADYEGARTDLTAVLTAKPEERRAQWGLLMCALCEREWNDASKALRALAKAGEIKPGDRVEPERVFADSKVWPGVVKGMRTVADLKVTDGTMHLLASWSLASLGQDDLARRYLRMARQWSGSHPALDALGKALDPDAQKDARKDAQKDAREKEAGKPGEKPEPKQPEKIKPKSNGEAGEHIPDPLDLHHQIARSPKKTPRIAKTPPKDGR